MSSQENGEPLQQQHNGKLLRQAYQMTHRRHQWEAVLKEGKHGPISLQKKPLRCSANCKPRIWRPLCKQRAQRAPWKSMQIQVCAASNSTSTTILRSHQWGLHSPSTSYKRHHRRGDYPLSYPKEAGHKRRKQWRIGIK